MVIDVFNFINSADYTIFPSSNSTGSGKVTSEKNIQNIIGRLQLKSYKSSATDFELSYDDSTEELSIASGKANIDGYWFVLANTAVAPLTLSADGEYNLKLGLIYDNNDLLAPDENGKSVCVELIAEEESTQPAPEYLWLGTITKSGSDYEVITSTSNIHAIALDIIVGPNNVGTLGEYLDTIPNTYVSKVANDTKIGNLDFKFNQYSDPAITLNPGSPSVEVTDGSGTTTIQGGKIVFDYLGAPFPTGIEAQNLILQDASWHNYVQIDDSRVTVYSVEPMLMPYVTTFGSTSASVKNLTVTIDKHGASPVISTTGSNLQMSINSGNGTLVVNGNLTATGDIHANRVYNAVFNGFGEFFQKDKTETIEYGDVVCVGPDGLVHTFNSALYSRASIIGVCSDSIGYIMGGADIPEDERVEVELVGQIWVKTPDLKICPGAMVGVNDDGTVSYTRNVSEKFGIALTDVQDGKVRILYNGH